MATPCLLFLLVIQRIIRKRMRTWRFWWTPLITINQMANLWWPRSDCLTTWTKTRIHKILLLHLWMGQQSSVTSLIKTRLTCQKISGSKNHECGKSTTSGTEENFVAIHAFEAWSDEKFCKGHEPRRSCFYLHVRKVPQTKWDKTERRCFHWSTNTRPYHGRILRHSPSRRRKGRLGQI